MGARERIEAIRARAEKATKGPWGENKYGGIGAGQHALMPSIIEAGAFNAFYAFDNRADPPRSEDSANFDFVLHARTDVPALCAALLDVLELHYHAKGAFREWCGHCTDEGGAGIEWPCPTVQAIERHMGGDR